jgi:hypothetical protein
LLLWSTTSYSQSSDVSIFSKIDPDKLSASVEKKLSRLKEEIASKSEKTLQHLQRQEERIYEKQLATKDSLQARLKLKEIKNKYKTVEEKLKNQPLSITPQTSGYIPHLDSLNPFLNC